MLTSNGTPYRHQELCLGTKEIDTPQEEIRLRGSISYSHTTIVVRGLTAFFFKLFDTLQKQFKLENHSFFLPVQWWEDVEESVTDPDCGSRNLEPLSLISEDQEKRVFGYEQRQILSVKFSPHNPDSST